MKKLILIICSLCILSACQLDKDKSNDTKSVNDNLEYIHYLTENNDKLVLHTYDITNKKSINQKEITVERNFVTEANIYESSDYTAVLVSSRDDVKNNNGLISYDDKTSVSNELIYFNNKLEVVEHVNIDKIFEDKNMSIDTKYCLNNNLTLLVGINYEKVYLYDLEKEQFVNIEDKIPDYTFLDMKFDSKNRLCYLAQSIDNQYYIGYFDIDTQKYYETEVAYNTDGNLYCTENYLYLNDSEEVYTQKSSGYIMVVDKEDFKAEKYVVDGLESTMSIISPDEQYIISFICEKENGEIRGYHSVIYDKSNMREVKEFSVEENITLSNIKVIGNCIYITPNSADKEVMRIEFK